MDLSKITSLARSTGTIHPERVATHTIMLASEPKKTGERAILHIPQGKAPPGRKRETATTGLVFSLFSVRCAHPGCDTDTKILPYCAFHMRENMGVTPKDEQTPRRSRTVLEALRDFEEGEHIAHVGGMPRDGATVDRNFSIMRGDPDELHHCYDVDTYTVDGTFLRGPGWYANMGWDEGNAEFVCHSPDNDIEERIEAERRLWHEEYRGTKKQMQAKLRKMRKENVPRCMRSPGDWKRWPGMHIFASEPIKKGETIVVRAHGNNSDERAATCYSQMSYMEVNVNSRKRSAEEEGGNATKKSRD